MVKAILRKFYLNVWHCLKTVSTNSLTTIPALPPQRVERLSEGLLLKLASLVLGRRLRAKRDEPSRVDANPEPAKGPYAYLVWALEGLPVARTVAEILEFEWAHTTLSTRPKAFVHAVVARGVGARVAEQEAVELLGNEGLEPDRVDAILEHLGGTQLEEVEDVGIPFARETIWYEPVQIQRSARKVRDRLSREQFTELIYVCALANAVARLSVIAEIA